MIGNQILDAWLCPGPLDLLLPGWANGLALLDVDPEIPQAETFRLAGVPFPHIATQVNTLSQTLRDMAATHVRLVDVLLTGRDPSLDKPVLDGSQALVVLAHGRHYR